MAQERYDQRVLVLVEVRGGPHDWEEAERRFDTHRWLIRSHHACGTGPTRGVLDPDPASRVYEVEVRLFGAARNCDRGASHRVHKAMRKARLEAYVRRADPILRDREFPTHWRVFSTTHRTLWPASRWRRLLDSYAVRLGRYDTGVKVIGSPTQALRLARIDATAGYVRTAPVAVRPLDGRWRDAAHSWPEEEGERRLFWAVLWALVTAASLVFASGRHGFAWWFWSVVVLLSLSATLWSGTRLHRNNRLKGAGIAAVATVSFAALAIGLPHDVGGQGWTRMQVLVSAALVAVLGGLRLLVRQWNWGEWVAWAVPLVVTLVVSSLLSAGSVLHALYADGFDLSPDDLDVPAIWQLAAALKLLMLLSIVMAVPAWWGYARHRHHSYAAPGDGFNVLLYVFLLILLLGGAAVLALHSAQTAVDRTTAAAKRGDTPSPYFGVQPQWTCVEPVVPLAKLSGEGPHLQPARPYLSFGVADDMAVLWDRAAEVPLKLRADQVRLVPAKSARVICESDGH
ncbi:hypothetical protein [Peterkaempfera bronchialis]|uniref:NnrS multi-domain protein n=1 Tax=Peterkaempfera bronchialis TaxID=2126346 RepID=A0A345SXK8_9ACTN|nr:hypothetical protein [Peterkaempfera bronchialis]AXI78463.1 hypothetical protein C7M71_014510 [Peterkaempfera bronchialis]